MHEPNIWLELKQRFQSIIDRGGELRAEGTFTIGGSEGWIWYLKTDRSVSSVPSFSNYPSVSNNPSISFTEEFEAIARQAGHLLSPESGDPKTVWLNALRMNKLSLRVTIGGFEDTDDGIPAGRSAIIPRVCEASVNLCRQLAAQGSEDTEAKEIEHLPPLASTSAEDAGDKEGEDEVVARKQRKIERQDFVLHRLVTKGWSPLQWAKEANIAHHTVFDYLSGKTKKLTAANQLALAIPLGLNPEELPK